MIYKEVMVFRQKVGRIDIESFLGAEKNNYLQ